MLGQLKTRLASLQEEITAGVAYLSSTGGGTSRSGVEEGDSSSSSSSQKNKVNFEAGSELLTYYQNVWEELHLANEANIADAEKCDKLIAELHNVFEKQWTDVMTLQNLVSQMPKINQSVESIMNTLGGIESLFTDVELSLLALEDTIDARELQEKQLDQRFQLAIYQERRKAEYADLQNRLQAEHQKIRQDAELQKCLVSRERQNVFQKQFEEDLETYKAAGPSGLLRVPISIPDHDVSLETVDLNDEDDNSSCLETFLEDVSPLPKDDVETILEPSTTSTITTSIPTTTTVGVAAKEALPRPESIYYTPDCTDEKLSSLQLDENKP